MSAVTETRTARPRAPESEVRSRFGGVLRGEFIRLVHLRSSAAVAAVAVVVGVGIAMLMPLFMPGAADARAAGAPSVPPSVTLLAGIGTLQLVAAFFGAMFVTTEASSGGLRASFLAVPRRLPVFAAKTVVIALGVFTGTVAVLTVSLVAGTAALAAAGLSEWTQLPSASSLVAVFGGALSITFGGLLGLGLGAAARSNALALPLVVVLLVIAPAAVGSFSAPGLEWLAHVLPTATALAEIVAAPVFLEAVLVNAAWAAGLLGLGAGVLQRRDA